MRLKGKRVFCGSPGLLRYRDMGIAVSSETLWLDRTEKMYIFKRGKNYNGKLSVLFASVIIICV